jgi:hypothetical protein
MPLDRPQTGMYTKVMQGVFAVTGAAAVTVAGLGVSRQTSDAPVELVADELPSLPKDTSVAMAPLDYAGSATRLGTASNAPRPTPPPPPPTTDKVEPVAPPPAPVEAQLKYLGPVSLGEARLALMNVGGKQRFIGLNEMLEHERVAEIASEKVRLAKTLRARKLPATSCGKRGVRRW